MSGISESREVLPLSNGLTSAKMGPSLRWGDGLWDAVLNIVAPAQAGAHVRSRNEAARKKNFNVQMFRTPVGLRRDDGWEVIL